MLGCASHGQVVVEKAGAGNKGTPMLDDPVNVLPGIGPETLQKLMDVGATAAAKGHSVPFGRISTGMPCSTQELQEVSCYE